MSIKKKNFKIHCDSTGKIIKYENFPKENQEDIKEVDFPEEHFPKDYENSHPTLPNGDADIIKIMRDLKIPAKTAINLFSEVQISEEEEIVFYQQSDGRLISPAHKEDYVYGLEDTVRLALNILEKTGAVSSEVVDEILEYCFGKDQGE